MKSASQLYSELAALTDELTSIEARKRAITDELDSITRRGYELTEFIKDKKVDIRKAQKAEWKPTKEWPEGIEFIIENSKHEMFPARDKWGYQCFKEFIVNGTGPRWSTEKAAQLRMADALKLDPSAKIIALPVGGEWEDVPYRPVLTV